MQIHEKINYIEIPSTNLSLSKSFFTQVFGWKFTDFGDEYTAFCDEGIDGGFFKSPNKMQTKEGSALVVFYSDNLEESYAKVIDAKGKIVQDIFEFPGGRRFHFEDLTGNEWAIWSKM